MDNTNSDFNLGSLVQKALERAAKERGRITILIAGRTGVGKSTLINAVFQGNMATAGQGRPVTKEAREIKKDGIPISIIDTRGMELANFQQNLKELEAEISKRNGNSDPMEHIHIGWVCVSEDSRRVEEADTELVKTFAKHFPVIGVITKSRADNGFRAEAQRLLPEARNVVRVRAISEAHDDGHSLQPMGLLDLVRLTEELVPEGQRNAFAAAQKVDIQVKVNRAHGIVAGSAAAAAGFGAIPIPFADAALLVPLQISELAGITAVFGLPLNKGFLTTLVATAAGCTGATFAGRALVTNLLKFFPGVGSAAGGLIAGSTAAALTVALGEAFIAVLTQLCKEKPMGDITEIEIADAFKRKLTGK